MEKRRENAHREPTGIAGLLRERCERMTNDATKIDRKRRGGFSLIELMIVVATIGAIASIGIPILQKYVYRAKRNEAYLNLNGIYKSQKAYQSENGQYGSTFDEIGFEILGATQTNPNTIESQYYTYTLETFDVGGVTDANYSAVATGDLDPSDAMLDIVMIEPGIIIKE